MTLELSISLILIILLIYIVMVNIFVIMLRVAGVPSNVAIFQGVSLFTNCGYTTGESESISTSKLRRKIALICMITGNFFSLIIVSLIVNIISSFNQENTRETYFFVISIVVCFIALMLITQIPPIKQFFHNIIQSIVDNRIEKNNKDNVISIVEHFAGQSVVEVHIHWIPEILYGKTIHESKLKNNYNINILSIQRDKKHIEITRNTLVQKNDRLLVFGDYNTVKEVFSIQNEREDTLKKVADSHIVHFNEIDLIDNFGPYALMDVRLEVVPDILKERTLFDSGLKEKYKINVIVIKRDSMILDINKDTEIKAGDKLVVYGPYAAIKNVFIYESVE